MLDEKDKDKEILDIFKNVAVNIPLLEVIKKILKYAKFLKDLCTHNRIWKGNERVNMGKMFLPSSSLMFQLSSRPCPKSARILELLLFHAPLGIINSKIACWI